MLYMCCVKKTSQKTNYVCHVKVQFWQKIDFSFFFYAKCSC